MEKLFITKKKSGKQFSKPDMKHSYSSHNIVSDCQKQLVHDMKEYIYHQNSELIEMMKKVPAHKRVIEMEGKLLEMEVDSGASYSVLSEDTFNKFFQKKCLIPPSIQLHTCGNKNQPVKGEGFGHGQDQW